jgi:hypothetical protein
MTRQHYIHSSLGVILCLPLHVHDHVENVPKHVFFYVHDVKVMAEEIGLPKKESPRKYFALSSCGSNQNQETSTYRIGNKHNVNIL